MSHFNSNRLLRDEVSGRKSIRKIQIEPSELLPLSVRGAPEHLKPAIRKKQNSEAAKRSRQRRKNKISTVLHCYNKRAAKISALNSRIDQLVRTIQEAGIEVPVPLPPSTSSATKSVYLPSKSAEGAQSYATESGVLSAFMNTPDDEKSATDNKRSTEVNSDLHAAFSDKTETSALDNAMPIPQIVEANNVDFYALMASELGENNNAPSPDQLFREIMSLLSEDQQGGEQKSYMSADAPS